MNRWKSADIRAELPVLRSYARALARDATEADDLVQDALLRAYERAETFRPELSLRSWLLAIVHNLFIDRKRRAASEQRRNARLIDDNEGRFAEGAQEQAVHLRELSARFAMLPEEQRAVISLVAVQGLSYQETATTLGVPAGTVMSRLHRARAALRDPDPAAEPTRLHIVGGKDVN